MTTTNRDFSPYERAKTSGETKVELAAPLPSSNYMNEEQTILSPSERSTNEPKTHDISHIKDFTH
ncbi:hypothetical protein Dda_0141 [Drechslerella dactyloides]|uniref:Uncharacterized protein n=1 Tax=Drechslerella dactyloides TaxID=74499 RepID=A0AAD6J573_DREDA|nr:hypothetical protein Dda_0141 [Drechslerella dactyloides]